MLVSKLIECLQFLLPNEVLLCIIIIFTKRHGSNLEDLQIPTLEVKALVRIYIFVNSQCRARYAKLKMANSRLPTQLGVKQITK